MTERIPKAALVAGMVLMLPVLALMAYSRPAYFTKIEFLGGIILFELLCASLWLYRQVFLPIVIVAFLLAGTGLPLASGMWTSGRWGVLAAGALAGSFILLKERSQHFGLFHGLAMFSILAALVSAAVSRYPAFALLKASSLLLLFLYAGTGARIAAAGREMRFTAGLLTGCEVFVVLLAFFYLAGREPMGNPNSLGAVMAVAGAPVLLWGTLVTDSPIVRQRRLFLYGVAMYLVFHSRSRAGLAAAMLSSAVLCLSLRRYRLLAQGLVIILILTASAAILYPEAFSERMSSLASSVVYKDKDANLGIFASRKGPWEDALESIRKHFWFGSGFGTTDNGLDASDHLSSFSTAEGTSSENGSSYLAILTWVGVLGVAPFISLAIYLMVKVTRTCLWMLNTTNPFHPAIPIAMVTLAGLVHAGLEDWLFAPGYYLCVFFWSMAFILVDLAPWAPLPSFSRNWRPWLMRREAGRIVPSR
ncbi:MAG TPA: O-antigen ligase family protein [Candidatus Sulfotelmatobacter sp.]|nr:O-antigen ligase family protein [Candidatus Sulfotelmatobacter sp.]